MPNMVGLILTQQQGSVEIGGEKKVKGQERGCMHKQLLFLCVCLLIDI